MIWFPYSCHIWSNSIIIICWHFLLKLFYKINKDLLRIKFIPKIFFCVNMYYIVLLGTNKNKKTKKGGLYHRYTKTVTHKHSPCTNSSSLVGSYNFNPWGIYRVKRNGIRKVGEFSVTKRRRYCFRDPNSAKSGNTKAKTRYVAISIMCIPRSTRKT